LSFVVPAGGKRSKRKPSFQATAVGTLLVLLSTVLPNVASSDEYRCQSTDADWVWFSDHFVASITYVTQAAPGRRYEIGTGVSFGGRPRGRIQEVEGKVEVTAYGLGALHMRFVDGLGPGTICAAQGSIRVVSFPAIEF